MKNRNKKLKFKIWETDAYMKKLSGGDRYFIPYAEGTKLESFRTKEQARRFMRLLLRGG